jgi:hypothetical protein
MCESECRPSSGSENERSVWCRVRERTMEQPSRGFGQEVGGNIYISVSSHTNANANSQGFGLARPMQKKAAHLLKE